MKAGNESMVRTSSLSSLLVCGVVAAFGAMACNGAISPEGMPPTGSMTGTGTGSTGTGGPMPTGPGAAGTGGGVTGTGGAPSSDPGRISIHRLNNLEYDNTMMDLVGVPGMAEATFQPDEQGTFDNDADAFTMNDARYEQYFNAADTIGETIFSTPALQAKIVTCTPTAATDTCTATIIQNFGLRAWRRPLTATEVSGLQTLAGSAITLGETPTNAIKQVVKTMLASPEFLYRIEFDANPASLAVHAVGPYELASRLSYLLFSSMPDPTLFTLATPAAGSTTAQIQTDATLTAQVDRMLADPKGANFTNSFAGQWRGARTKQAHQVEPNALQNKF